MKTVTFVWLDGSGRTTFTCQEYVDAIDSVYLHNIDSMTGEPYRLGDMPPGTMPAKKARIPISAVLAVFYE